MEHTAKVAVIGAGAAGLSAAKALLDEGCDVTVLEKGDQPGGLWVQGNSSGLSPAYDSLHLNTSKGRTEFADFPMPAEWPDYPSAQMIAGYLRDYSDHFGVTERTAFHTEATRVERTDAGWRVEATGPDGPYVLEVDAVVVGNGHNWDPRWPDPAYPGEFTGEQMHAHDHRSAERFVGRRVLVVGMGNSAMDIAVDASYVAASPVLLSARHGVHIVPKYLFGKPSDATGAKLAQLPWRARQKVAETMLKLAVGTPQSYGLPAPAGGLFQNHPTISDTILHRITHGEVVPRPGVERFDGRRVHFTDGRVDEVDVIVWATGYRVTIPFLSSRWLGADPEEMPLYERVFHLDDPTLSFVGLMQSTGAALPVVEAQGKLVAAHLSGRYALPTPAEMTAAVHRARTAAVARWGARKRPMMRIDFDAYVAAVPAEVAAGIERACAGAPVFSPRTLPASTRQEIQT
ncbi:flavin-containing monooxygenase [Nocardioides gilvus]|uniref:flavin-containing monooxygenase n=1 Tax=Nocardioides gilvus TaxID=1735589 RepID=UPI000D74CC3C|nr:FAD-dependent oxidoreductase [Nocardioides gilvus]